MYLHMHSTNPYYVLGLSLLHLTAVRGQTSTSCNPTDASCPSDQGLLQSSYSVDFTQGASADWNMTYGTVVYSADTGAAFTVAEQGDAPTMQSDFYIFFGEISVEMQTAPGTGIVSCAILESDDLDEVDFEWIGGEASEAETNYFGKGNTTLYNRELWVAMTSSSQSAFHNYTFKWTEAQLEWLIDGASVRTLAYADALDGANYPQTPMRVKLGIWAGGDPDNAEGTIEWAGGETDYSQGPFTAYVKSVSIVNYNPASSYTYGDMTGSYESIQINGSEGNTSSVATESDSSSDTTSSANSTSVEGTTPSSDGTSSSSSSTTSSNSSSESSSSSSVSNSTSTPSSSTSSSSSTAATAGATSWGPDTAFLTTLLSMLSFAALMA